MKSLKELGTERADLVAAARKLLDTADADKRSLSAEEREHYDRIETDIEKLSGEIDARRATDDRRERHARIDARLAQDPVRQIPPSIPGVTGRTAGTDGADLRFSFGRAGELSVADLRETDTRLAESLQQRATPQYRQSFNSYLRGDHRNFESLGLQVGQDPQGGYLAPMGFVATLIKFLDDLVTVRRLATVLPPTSAKSVGALSYDTDYADADWTAEVPASDISEDSAARFGRREMMPHLLSKLVKSSRKLLRSSTLPIESFLAQRMAYKFGITENKAFLVGSGAQRPLGMYVASNDGIPTSRDTTCASATAFTADELIDTQESLKDVYQQRASWLVSRGFRQRARKLKTGTGEYLLQEPASGMTTLLGRPLIVDENAPSTFTAAQYIAVFADFSYYWIQDGIDLEIQRLDELFSLKNQVGWVGRKETDAMPVLAEAFARLILNA